MKRLVVVSNRVGNLRGAAKAGGLAVGVAEAMRGRKGLWFGWSGEISSSRELHLSKAGRGEIATVDLSQEEFDLFYGGFANRCLWPLLHFRIDLVAFEQRFADAYHQVNRRFAETLRPMLNDNDLIWAHDYHLMLLASELRALGVRNRLGFFLHTPFPPHDVLATLPGHRQLIQSLCDYDLLGFQTDADARRFREYLASQMQGADGKAVEVGAFPIGIDAEEFHALSFSGRGEQEFRMMRTALRGRRQIMGVDRLDYSKGLLRRMGDFEIFLTRNPDALGKIEYLQVAPISRGELKAYRDFRRELEQAAVRINSRFAQVDWTPVRYINQILPRDRLAGIYRASAVGLVTPMRDGMNLVAKEYVAAQDPKDPGVLVLSCFAGAAAQMHEALTINPYNGVEVADALSRALCMSLSERRRRYEALMNDLTTYNAARWSADFLARLEMHDVSVSPAPSTAGRRQFARPPPNLTANRLHRARGVPTTH